MSNSIHSKRVGIVLMLFVVFVGFVWVNAGYGQTQRNPVLEFCTGTW